MKHLTSPDNMVWTVVRDVEPASYAKIAAEVELEAVRRGIAPFWVWHAFRRLCKQGQVYATPEGYRARGVAEIRRSR